MKSSRTAPGYSLIELMVALALGMLIVIALLTLLINVNRNSTETVRTNSVIEAGRFSVQVLESDVAHAGFWAGFVPQFDDLSLTGVPADFPGGIPDPCLKPPSSWTQAHLNAWLGIPLQVYEVPSTGGLAAIGTCPSLSGVKAKTHVIVVRHAAACAASAGASEDDCKAQAGHVYFQRERCAVSPSTSTGYTLALATINLANLKLLDKDCVTTSNRFKFVTNIYWVRNYAVTAGDGLPALMRTQIRFDGTAPSTDSIVEGIEGLRVDLAIDDTSRTGRVLTSADFGSAIVWESPTSFTRPVNRGDGSADRLRQCTATLPCSAFELANVVALKLNVLARATSATPGYVDSKSYKLGSAAEAISVAPNDGYKRHLFAQTIRLTNVSTRREVAQ